MNGETFSNDPSGGAEFLKIFAGKIKSENWNLDNNYNADESVILWFYI